MHSIRIDANNDRTKPEQSREVNSKLSLLVRYCHDSTISNVYTAAPSGVAAGFAPWEPCLMSQPERGNMPKSEAIRGGSGKLRPDGRKQLLVYISPDVILETKKAALDRGTSASALVEEALQEWLARRGKGGKQKR